MVISSWPAFSQKIRAFPQRGGYDWCEWYAIHRWRDRYKSLKCFMVIACRTFFSRLCVRQICMFRFRFRVAFLLPLWERQNKFIALHVSGKIEAVLMNLLHWNNISETSCSFQVNKRLRYLFTLLSCKHKKPVNCIQNVRNPRTKNEIKGYPICSRTQIRLSNLVFCKRYGC